MNHNTARAIVFISAALPDVRCVLSQKVILRGLSEGRIEPTEVAELTVSRWSGEQKCVYLRTTEPHGVLKTPGMTVTVEWAEGQMPESWKIDPTAPGGDEVLRDPEVPEGAPVLVECASEWEDGAVFARWVVLCRPDGSIVEGSEEGGAEYRDLTLEVLLSPTGMVRAQTVEAHFTVPKTLTVVPYSGALPKERPSFVHVRNTKHPLSAVSIRAAGLDPAVFREVVDGMELGPALRSFPE